MMFSKLAALFSKVFYYLSAFVTLIALLGSPVATAAPAILTGDNNKLPNACQGSFGATWLAAEITSIAAPPTPTGEAIKLGADTASYFANLGLELCAPAITPPEPKYFVPDSVDSCTATIHQPLTKGDYNNILGLPTSYLFAGVKEALGKTTWGDLGRPLVFDFNTSADVRLIDPAKEEGSEDDAWMPDANGNITLPIGHNNLVWRADSEMSIADIAPTFLIPFVAPGDKIAQKLVMKNKFMSETAYKTYGRLTRYGDGGKVRTFISKLIVKKIRSSLETLPKNVVDTILKKSVTNQWRISYITGLDIAHNSVVQDVGVFDNKAPTLETNKDFATFPSTLQPLLTYDAATDTYYLEAFAPRIPDFTIQTYGKMLLSAHDDCQGSRPPLDPMRLDTPKYQYWVSGDTDTLKWQVTDSGPSQKTGGPNYSPVVDQKFEVRDTSPPALIAPPSKVVETSGTSANVQLGSPRVFDLADLTPSVSNDVNNDPTASPSFNLGINTVTWTATDSAGNSTTKQQLINVKVAGTNTAPIGYNQSVSAVSYKPVDIILTGYDADTDPNTGRHDPLSFTIKDKPANGFFVAPLLPYFIDDYRLEASALRFTGQPEQVDPVQYCKDLQDGIVSGPDNFQMKYPYMSKWFNVDDDGVTAVYDQGSMLCNYGSLDSSYRLATFDADGNLIHSTAHQISIGSTLTNVYIDWHTKGVYTLDNTDPGEPDHIAYYDKNLNPLGTFNAEYTDSNGTHRITGTGSITADTQGIVYVAGPGETGDVVAAYQGPTTVTELGTNNLYNRLGLFYSSGDNNMRDIATDSEDNVYISKPDRILKFAASSIDDQGKLVPGAFIGWMGHCDSNLTNTYACDTVHHRSIGYSCSDALCGFDTVKNPHNYGSDPAQFNDARGIAVDPHDILYVSDYGNSRVQRFTPDGDFAGQAVSNGAGYGFILGDFGKPKDITVNSDHFYILNNNLLHVLQTTPVTPIDDSSAKVTYQSNNNFVGTDTFSFDASDGLMKGTGTVTVNVERNYRPPVISVPPSYTLNEDGTANITLVGSDPDGILDVLSYSIVDQPAHGTLSGTDANLVYTPDANYNGVDSFTYRVSDGVYQSAPATVALTINPVEDPPQVTAPATDDEGLGYKFQFPIDVFDPDADESLMVTIDWGDGTMDHDGVIEDKDGNVMTGDYLQPDGTLQDGLQATGPILNLDSDGNGTVTFEHAYTDAKNYNAQICVTDRVQTLSDGTKQVTTDSQTRCMQTTFTVTLTPDLLLFIAPDADHADPGTTQAFTITVTDRPFDVNVSGYANGPDSTNITVSGAAGSSLGITQPTASQGSCSLDQGTLSCNLGDLASGKSATVKVMNVIDSLAPGNAILTMHANRQGDGIASLDNDAIGAIMINASGNPPSADSLSVTSGSSSGGTALTIIGKDFDANADVLFDNVPADDVNVIDSGTIQLTTPAHLVGTVDVVVVNSDNQTSSLSKAFKFINTTSVASGSSPSGGGGGSIDVASIIFMILVSYMTWLNRRRTNR